MFDPSVGVVVVVFAIEPSAGPDVVFRNQETPLLLSSVGLPTLSTIVIPAPGAFEAVAFVFFGIDA